MGFTCFKIHERGKIRQIKSVKIAERTVQKCLVTYALRPIIEPRLMYDSSSSIKNKGTDFAIKRLRQHLAYHYRKHGLSGGILLMDYSKYFDSIDHDILLKELKKVVLDDRLFCLTKYFIDQFDGNKGLGLGSEVSQICAVFYVNQLDHYIKENLYIHGYGRYMDDSYIICDNIYYLKFCKHKIEEYSQKKLKLKLNPKMTRIVKFKNGHFSYLKKRFHFSNTGKIVMRLDRSNSARYRRKLKRIYKHSQTHNVNMNSIKQGYDSWRSYALKCNSYKTINNMDSLYNQLFGGE